MHDATLENQTPQRAKSKRSTIPSPAAIALSAKPLNLAQYAELCLERVPLSDDPIADLRAFSKAWQVQCMTIRSMRAAIAIAGHEVSENRLRDAFRDYFKGTRDQIYGRLLDAASTTGCLESLKSTLEQLGWAFSCALRAVGAPFMGPEADPHAYSRACAIMDELTESVAMLGLVFRPRKAAPGAPPRRPLPPLQAKIERILREGPHSTTALKEKAGIKGSDDGLRGCISRMNKAGHRVKWERGVGYFLAPEAEPEVVEVKQPA